MPIRGKPSLHYLAGLFDGEGTINIGKRQVRPDFCNFQLNVAVRMCARRQVMFFHARWPATTFALPPQWELCRVQHAWAITGTKASAFLEEIYPYLDLKAPQALLAIEFQKLLTATRNGVPTDNYAKREQMWRDMRSLNGRLRVPAETKREDDAAASKQ